MGTIELTTHLGRVKLRNPILPGASELAFDGQSVQRLIDAGVGAVVTKSFTSDKQARIRLRPYQFSLNRFGKAPDRSIGETIWNGEGMTRRSMG